MSVRTIDCAFKAVEKACSSVRTYLTRTAGSSYASSRSNFLPKVGNNTVQVSRTVFNSPTRIGLGVLLLSESASVLFAPRAHCVRAPDANAPASEDPKNEDGSHNGKPDDDAFIDLFVENLGKAAMKAGFGGMLGFAAGYAAKQVTKAALVVVGVLFIILQALAYAGFIQINWGKLRSSMERMVAKGEDGKVTIDDMKSLLKGTFTILKYNLPSATTFVPCFYYGFMY